MCQRWLLQTTSLFSCRVSTNPDIKRGSGFQPVVWQLSRPSGKAHLNPNQGSPQEISIPSLDSQGPKVISGDPYYPIVICQSAQYSQFVIYNTLPPPGPSFCLGCTPPPHKSRTAQTPSVAVSHIKYIITLV